MDFDLCDVEYVSGEGFLMNIYETDFQIDCPEDSAQITYTLTIETTEKVMVERINEAITALTTYSRHHEDIADLLANDLPGLQRLTAEHQGVRILTQRYGR